MVRVLSVLFSHSHPIGSIYKALDSVSGTQVAIKVEKKEGVEASMKNEFDLLKYLSDRKVSAIPKALDYF